MRDRTRAIVLAAGLGTRLRPLTDRVPKCLVPIGGRPLLDQWIDLLAAAGIRDAWINTHSLAGEVRAYIGRVNDEGRVHLTERYEAALLGSAGTITATVALADDADHVAIIYADNFSTVDLGRLLDFHRGHGDPFTMLLFHAPQPSACGIVELDDAGRVLSFVEKPREPKGDLANAGVYIVTADAYREIAALHAFDLGFEVLPRFVGRMRGQVWDGFHLDIGTFSALEQARRAAPKLLAARQPGVAIERRPAVFFDRDGTLIEHVHYLADPARVRLLPGAVETLKRCAAAGFARVVVTNQSAIGRGYINEDQLRLIHDEMQRQLAAEGADVDAIYYCPVAPEGDDRTLVEHPDRKPGPGMLLRAADDLGLDLAASWMVGDLISDVLTGINAGCRGSILLRTGQGAEAPAGADRESLTYLVADNLLDAADQILLND